MVAMLVTRPEPDASDTAARLDALDIEAVVGPLLIAETLPHQPARRQGLCRAGA